MGLVQCRRQAKGFRWKGRGEGSAGSRLGEEFARSGAQRPWKQVERRVPGKEESHGGAVGEVKSRGHPGIPHLIPPSTADHGFSVDTSCARRCVPSTSTHHTGSHCLGGFMPLGSNRGPQLKPQLLSSAEIT